MTYQTLYIGVVAVFGDKRFETVLDKFVDGYSDAVQVTISQTWQIRTMYSLHCAIYGRVCRCLEVIGIKFEGHLNDGIEEIL